MFFTSYEFIGFFMILLLLYYIIPRKWQWKLLLFASYLFYFAADPRFVLYIIAITVLTYAAARMMERNLIRQKAYLKEHKATLEREQVKAYKNAQKRIRRRWLIVCLVAVLGILIGAKYTNFLIANFNSILNTLGQTRRLSFVSLIMPLGISFYTFQAISYLIDVYRETFPAEKNLFRYALFVSFFPQLIQGPISRYGDLSQTLWKEHAFCWENIRNGLFRMLWGYFKKLVVADRIMIAVNEIIGNPDTYHGAYIFVVMIFYTIELYADFTGGIDITIGIAQTMGIQVKENFMLPYFSKSLKEYWRRWHISMSTWFKDYIFYPVSVSTLMRNISKFVKAHFGEKAGKRFPVYLASIIVWLATGIWHGANWNFVVWGLLNCAVLLISEELEPLYQKFHDRFSFGKSRGYQFFQILRTLALICILNLFDCYAAVTTTVGMLLSVPGAGNWHILTDGSLLSLGLTMTDYFVLMTGILIMLAVSLMKLNGNVRERIMHWHYPLQVAVWLGLIVLILLWGTYGIGYDASQFIYNQF